MISSRLFLFSEDDFYSVLPLAQPFVLLRCSGIDDFSGFGTCGCLPAASQLPPSLGPVDSAHSKGETASVD